MNCRQTAVNPSAGATAARCLVPEGRERSPWTLLDVTDWFLTAIYCSAQGYLFTAQTWVTPLVTAGNQRRGKVRSRPQPGSFRDSVIPKISEDMGIIFTVFSAMRVSRWNEFPGWTTPIRGVTPPPRCCKALVQMDARLQPCARSPGRGAPFTCRRH